MRSEIFGTEALLLSEIQLQDINFPLGKSTFFDDVWDFSNVLTDGTISQSRKEVNFSHIKNGEMKNVTKLYACYCLRHTTIKTVVAKINSFMPPFFEFCEKVGLYSFKQMSIDLFVRYAAYLREERKYSESAGYYSTYIIEELLKAGYARGWSVAHVSFAEINSRTLWNRRNENKKHTNPIPDFVLDQIVTRAKRDEEDPNTRGALLLQSQTGLRINEVLRLEEGCICYDDYGPYLKTFITKTSKGEPSEHRVYLNDVALEAVKRLEKDTEHLRKEARSKALFLYRGRDKKIRQMTGNNFQGNRVPAFVKRWKIVDEDEKLYYFHTHQFRATFAQKVIKSGFSMEYIRQQFGHVSLEMTIHYLQISREEIQTSFAEKIFHPNAVIAGKKAHEIRTRLEPSFKGKTEPEIRREIERLAKKMSFNPLPTGICVYNTLQASCKNGTGCFFYNCENFVTSREFLPIFKQELELLELNMERCTKADMTREWQRNHVVWEKLKRLVDDLEGNNHE